MKNPIAHIKHLVKDPINTIDEANARKKEIMPWLYGSIALAVVPSVLSGIVDVLSFLMIFGLIGIFGVMLFGFLLFVIKKAKEKFDALTCDKCKAMTTIKTPEEYAAFVSYTIKSDVASYGGVSHPASNNGVVDHVTAKGSASAVVSIQLKCPNCGNVKDLSYIISPFRCSVQEKKVAVKDVEIVKMRLENAVKAVVDDYNDPDKRANVPYSIHSKHNPKYDQRTKAQAGNDTVAYPRYNGVKIDYHKDVAEMVDAFFLENQLDGKIVDPNKPQKSK